MIKIAHLKKSFADNQVLKDLSLEIPAGKITVILGPSGSGKSVLLKHIMGLLTPDSGTIHVGGVLVGSLHDKEKLKFRSQFGMLFQGGALFDSLTVAENIAFPLKEHSVMNHREITKKVEALLQAVGLPPIQEKMPSELSGGMRKRVGLARALALEPGIILYDEPTTGLDPIRTGQINRLIVETQRRTKATSLVISHDIEAAFEIGDQIAVLFDGRILTVGSVDEIKQSSIPFVKNFLEGRDDASLDQWLQRGGGHSQ